MSYKNVDHWSNLPARLFIFIAQRFSFLGHFFRLWKNSASDLEKPCLPPASLPLLSEGHNDSNNVETHDSGSDFNGWSDLPPEILVLISRKFSLLSDYYRFIAVCKSWRDSVSELEKPCLPLTGVPFLFLAEDVAPGAMLAYDPSQENDRNDNIEYHKYDHSKNSVGSSRGLFSLLTRKTYSIHLPEAAGRLVLGTNKGWLVTLGRDLQINLLHPLLNHQISLPNMLTFPDWNSFHKRYEPENAADFYIRKVAVSSNILNEDPAFRLYHHHPSPSPTVMTIYGSNSILGFARLGDNVWTDVDVSSRNFDDVVYHEGNFFAVDCHGSVFVCGINDEGGGDIRGTEIASLRPTKEWDKKYLVKSTSGSSLLLLVRYLKKTLIKYRTTNFSVWRLDMENSEALENISYTLKEVNDLGNEALFVGNASSTAILSSEIIKPNCIYFTDDHREGYYRDGGGHDMGIFSMEHHTIEPHFQGKSYHPISPPLWYI
ncbi:putative F-box protein At5g55150 [Apium graveolens]|uniref:putative F-box protein At5g55150 n=1 Tax=Apium graveolens TaxID=4045 RepID=UPI003D78F161